MEAEGEEDKENNIQVSDLYTAYMGAPCTKKHLRRNVLGTLV